MMDKKLFLAGASALALFAYSSAALADESSDSYGDYSSYDATGADIEGASTVSGNKVIDWMSSRANDIGGDAVDGSGSFNNGASGVVHVQQNNGSANGLENGTAIQAGLTSHIGFLKSKAKLNLQTNSNKSIVKGAEDDPGSPGTPTIIEKTIDPDTGEIVEETIEGTAAIPASNKDFDDRLNTIGNTSFDGFDGVASVQQNNGDANQIGISTSIASVALTQEGNGYHKAEVIGTTSAQTGKGYEAKDAEWQSMGVFSDAILDEDSDVLNSISNAFNGASGIFQVQQNNGNGNAIGSATSVVHSRDYWGTLHGGLGVAGTTMDNAVVDVNVNRENLIENAFNDASGATTVQQNNGHSNFMGAATSIVFAEDGPAMTGGLTDGSLSNTVTNNAVQVEQGDVYANNIASAFQGFGGIAQVQQNNGNANSLATGVHVSVSGIGGSSVPSLPFGTGVSTL